jgi:hypothetical protein
VPVISSPAGRQIRLVLSESLDDAGQATYWVGPLLALGTRAARYARRARERQLIVAVSVPRRDFAAALIGCGWVLASTPPVLTSPLDTLRSVEPGTPIRLVNSRQVVTGFFSALDESTNPPRVLLTGSTWQVNSLRALAALQQLEQPERAPRPEPGSIEHMAGLDSDWEARLALPAADLAIVGTVTWLKDDFTAFIAREDDDLAPSSIRDLLMPKLGHVATWFTRVYASARFADQLPLSEDVRCAILDGSSAIRYVGEVEAPVVVCVLDRSVADETAAEVVVQLRNTRGEPVTSDELGWHPPAGVEVLAFTVAL